MSAKAGSYDATSRKKDHITRGDNSTNWPGILTFIGLRAADPFVQYGILAQGWGSSLITTLGGTVLPQGPALLTGTALDSLALSPYRSVLLAMSIGSMLKQNIHVATIMQERVEPPFGVMIGAFNTFCNSANDLLFICAQTSASANGQAFPQTPLLVGAALFVSGIAIELGSEVQRHNFKKDSKNKGKVYTGGLFSLSRHINYFGYTLWRAGYALAGGGWTWAAVVTAYFVVFFAKNSIPLLQHYLEDRYGEQYEKYKKDVPYSLIPYIY